jgi:hypothetical protein
MTTSGQEEEPHDAFEVVIPERYASSQCSHRHRLVDLIAVYNYENWRVCIFIGFLVS